MNIHRSVHAGHTQGNIHAGQHTQVSSTKYVKLFSRTVFFERQGAFFLSLFSPFSLCPPLFLLWPFFYVPGALRELRQTTPSTACLTCVNTRSGRLSLLTLVTLFLSLSLSLSLCLSLSFSRSLSLTCVLLQVSAQVSSPSLSPSVLSFPF